MSEVIQRLTELGQSLWYDNIERRLLINGGLEAMIQRCEIRGVTSNPSIFNNAIAKSNDYDAALIPLAWAGLGSEDIFWQLAVEDIQAAADLFHPLYEETKGGDGYVSLEVSPYLADDTQGTIDQAIELWKIVDRPNLMIKIPATRAGIPAIRQAIAAGVNINVTLIFSLTRYSEVMDAYLNGLEDRLKTGHAINHIASVASFFVSRVDSKVDGRLQELIQSEGSEAEIASRLLGKAAIANAKLAYLEFNKMFSSERFEKLRAVGGKIQRPLWASTSTKNPTYPDTLYVDQLIGPDTVNTVPPQTLEAYKDHGHARVTINDGIAEAQSNLEELESLGILMSKVTEELEVEGVNSFADAFTALLNTIEERCKSEIENLGPLAVSVSKKVSKLDEDRVVSRMYELDPSLWTSNPDAQEEIRFRLGWLSLPESSISKLADYKSFANEIRDAGFSHVVLLGMGGSSLAPEVMSLMFNNMNVSRDRGKSLTFSVLDSTDPGQVSSISRKYPAEHTLYIIASKSGTTSEVQALFKYFWERTARIAGKSTGNHFVAITDPGTELEKMALDKDFRQIFLAEPTVGGRYSALTAFGLVPAALLGIELDTLRDRAAWMASQCSPDIPTARNPGLVLGAILGCGALEGFDKLTILVDEEFAPFGTWLEQLIAESSGKQGKGILPVAGEPIGGLENYGRDRLFVYFRFDGEFDKIISILERSGHPVVVIKCQDFYDIGAEFFRWEFATAVACSILNVNAFDQPDVQDSKDRTRAKLSEFRLQGNFTEEAPAWELDNIKVYSPETIKGPLLVDVLDGFLGLSEEGDFIAINAYIPRNKKFDATLQKLREIVRSRTGCATTVGFGPRFLHSTGQLHKGGQNSGLFLQITADPASDIAIPGEGLTFGQLQKAQALGDYEALLARHRRLLRLHLPSPNNLKKIVERLEVLKESV